LFQSDITLQKWIYYTEYIQVKMLPWTTFNSMKIVFHGILSKCILESMCFNYFSCFSFVVLRKHLKCVLYGYIIVNDWNRILSFLFCRWLISVSLKIKLLLYLKYEVHVMCLLYAFYRAFCQNESNNTILNLQYDISEDLYVVFYIYILFQLKYIL